MSDLSFLWSRFDRLVFLAVESKSRKAWRITNPENHISNVAETVRAVLQDFQSVATGAYHPEGTDMSTVQTIICGANYQVDLAGLPQMDLGSLESRWLKNIRASSMFRAPYARLQRVAVAFQ